VTRAGAFRVSRHRLASVALILGATGLAALGGIYWFTYEPAPAVRVRWRDDLSVDRQAELERHYLLSNRRAPHPEAPRSFAYDLLDTRPANIEALVRDPDVGDTNDIDREHFVIRVDRQSGERWMWAAHRTPGLRDARVRWSLVAVLAGFLVCGCWWLQHPRTVLPAGRI
jgi:hypothetical protein